MEATAVSLARSVLDVVLSSARSTVADEVARILGVPSEVEFIRNELEMMRSFLRAASAHPEASPVQTDQVRTLVKQVRDLAYDVEDCLLDFALYAARISRSRAGTTLLPSVIAERRRIATRIRDLKTRFVEMNQRHQRYNIAVHLPAAQAEEDAATLIPEHDVNSAELAFQESDIIGRLKEKAELIKLITRPEPEPEPEESQVLQRSSTSWLRKLHSWIDYIVPSLWEASRPSPLPSALRSLCRGDDGTLRVVSVWGIDGMGKSSLARMVHNDPVLLDEFDCGAWITVPHPLDNPEVIRRRLRKELGLASNQNIELHLRDKRFRVVVDDVLTQEEWDEIRKVFQFQNNKGSRIIVTTQREDVAKHCVREGNEVEGNELIYKLEPLGKEESMNLLCRKIFKTTEYTLSEGMNEQALHILNKCNGLPLAISTIGGILANRPKTSLEWKNMHDHLAPVLESLRDIPNAIISSSFDGLPYHLKSILLYLSIFPENHEIKRTRLLRRWMAEGYIEKHHDMPVEIIGNRYYSELINRSMIQPSKVSPGARVDRCRVHSIVRQMILSESIDENQLFVIEKYSYEVPQSIIRHLVVSRSNRRDEKLQSLDLSYIRSLTIFGDYPASLNSSKMPLLRVLDLEDTINLKNADLKHIGELRHLRYLGLRGTDISNIPSSLQNLRCLETLDIQDTKVTQLHGSIAKLEKLRYLLSGFSFTKDLLQKMRESGTENHEAIRFGNIEVCQCYISKECCKVFDMDEFSLRAPKGLEKLKNLHTLGAVNFGNGSGVVGSLNKLTNLSNLCKLGITGLTEKEGNALCNSIGELSRLQRLELRSDSLKFLGKWNETLVPRHLVSLRLCGNLTRLPEWIGSLNNLAKVKLLGTRLEQGDIVRLENLRNLALLGLWENSYIGDSLRFFTGTFPKLKFLDIEGLDKIKKVQIKKGAMCKLEQLWVNKCPSLHDDRSGLSGVSYLLNLNELLLKKCGDKEDLIKILQRQVNGHKKRPKFLIGKSIVQTNPVLPSRTTEQ